MQELLENSTQKQLIFLIQKLLVHHPTLTPEIVGLLKEVSTMNDGDIKTDTVPLSSEEWQDTQAQKFFPLPYVIPPPLDLDAYRKRIEGYATRVKQEEEHSAISDELVQILREANKRANYEDYQAALDLYALVLDTRLAEREPALTPIFEEAINAEINPLHEMLTEASSYIMVGTPSCYTPLLSAEERQHWLERLFTLWIKRLDNNTIEEDVPVTMIEMAWVEDKPFLRRFAQEELERLRDNNHQAHIVDLARQYRMRAMERFLKELLLLT